MSRQISHLIVHCSASPASADIGVAEIDRTHRERGFHKIGYHYVIRRNGHVEIGRPEHMIGAHATGFNNRSISICLVGGVDKKGRGEANFTQLQLAALRSMLVVLSQKYPQAQIIGHRDTGAKKDCPSFDVGHWLLHDEIIHPRNVMQGA